MWWIVLRKHKIYSIFFYHFSTLRWAIWLKSLHEEDKDHLPCRVNITAADALALPEHQQPWHWPYSGIFQSLAGLNNIFENLVVLQATWPQNSCYPSSNGSCAHLHIKPKISAKKLCDAQVIIQATWTGNLVVPRQLVVAQGNQAYGIVKSHSAQ